MNKRTLLRPSLSLALSTAAALSPLRAQEWALRLRSGDRIRVSVLDSTPRFDAELQGVLRDSVYLRGRVNRFAPVEHRAIAISNIRTLDLSTGHSRLLWGFQGLLLGAVAGGAIGAVVGNRLDSQCTSYANRQPGQCYYYSGEEHIVAFILGVFGAAAGGVTGGVVGALVSPEHWNPVVPAPAPQD